MPSLVSILASVFVYDCSEYYFIFKSLQNLIEESIWPMLAKESLKALGGLGLLSFGGKYIWRRVFEVLILVLWPRITCKPGENISTVNKYTCIFTAETIDHVYWY